MVTLYRIPEEYLILDENLLKFWLKEYTESIRRKRNWIVALATWLLLTIVLMSATFSDTLVMEAQTLKQFFYCADAILLAYTIRTCWDAYRSRKSIATPEALIEMIKSRSVR